jgi:acetyl-CoA carboxylase carboxyl transferase subunit alpha
MRSYLDFEKPVAELEAKADDLLASAEKNDSAAMREEARKLSQRASNTLKDIYGQLTPWQKTLVARHPLRPHFKDYVATLIEEFTPLSGDRAFAEDFAIVVRSV